MDFKQEKSVQSGLLHKKTHGIVHPKEELMSWVTQNVLFERTTSVK